MPVQADQADPLPCPDREIDAVQHRERSVTGGEALQAQDIAHGATASK
jgi:hypothetical protein